MPPKKSRKQTNIVTDQTKPQANLSTQPIANNSSNNNNISNQNDKINVDTPKQQNSDLKRKAQLPLDPPQLTKKIKLDDNQQKIVKIITKGGVAVDSYVPNKQNYRVLQQLGKIYSATLNQSNLNENNNKFYIIQILQNQTSSQIYFWNRWGRVGVPGQNNLKGPYNKLNAIKDYNTKLKEKTVKGDYKQLQIKFDEEEEKNADKPLQIKELKTGTSKLDKSVQNLINLIFDTNIINTTMKEIGYDSKKMPLGKLGETTIKQAYSVLTKLTDSIKNKNYQEIKQLSGQFYTLIPHDFGFKKMINFILDNDQKVNNKIKMLEAISDMKITTKLLENQNSQEDVIDQNYKKLNCQINTLAKDSQEYQVLSQYLHNTKENWTIQIQDIFKIHREIQDKVFDQSIGNRMLLWHGSRITNFVGILSQGLRIAPPEAPVSGYLFGKGIYLADMIDKSAHYCRSYGSDKALVLLIQGAIGNSNILLSTSYNAKQEMEKCNRNSTKCYGRLAPPPQSYVQLNGITVPKGKPVQTGSGSYMGHNQYIVYNTNQARIKYVVQMKMG